MSYTVAIADDEEMMRRGLTHMIPWGELGYEVVAAVESGRAMIDYLQAHPVDVVLTDVNMDDMSGIDVARFIHECLPDTVTVVISGYDEFVYAQQSLEQGVYKYLLKPVSVNEMRALLRKLKTEIDHRRRVASMETRLESLRPHLLNRFVRDAARGALRDDDTLMARIREDDIDGAFLARPCAICSFILPMSASDADEYDVDPFCQLFERLNLPLECRAVYAEGDWLRMLLIENQAGALPDEADADDFTQRLAQRIYQQTGRAAWVYVEQRYENVRALCREGFETWNLAALPGPERMGGGYGDTSARHGVLRALRTGDRVEMRESLASYLRGCAESSHGIWHARFMTRVLLWQMAEIIDGG